MNEYFAVIFLFIKFSYISNCSNIYRLTSNLINFKFRIVPPSPLLDRLYIVRHDRFEITAGQKIMLQAGTKDKRKRGWRDKVARR